jgi:hypothetical protein
MSTLYRANAFSVLLREHRTFTLGSRKAWINVRPPSSLDPSNCASWLATG